MRLPPCCGLATRARAREAEVKRVRSAPLEKSLPAQPRAEVAGEFFRGVVEQARVRKLLFSEHFTVDGTLIEASDSLKSFRRTTAARAGRRTIPATRR
jgi:hypothetical protein